MSSTFTIQLNKLIFFGKHGLFAEEAQTGNEFEVNISLTIKAPKAIVSSLDETINYAEVYRIAKEIFTKRRDLLETLAMEMAEELRQQFPLLKKTSIHIVKLHPPIATFTGSVSVRYEKLYKQ